MGVSISQKSLDNTFLATMMVAVATFPFSSKIYFISVLAAFAVWIMCIASNRGLFRNAKINLHFQIIALVYIFLVIGLIWTDNIRQGFRELETMSSFVALPLLIFYSRIKAKQVHLILATFSISITLICLYSFGALIQKASINQQPLSYIFTNYYYQTSYFSEAINIHPTYLSIFASFATIYLLTAFSRQGTLGKVGFGLSLIVLITSNVLLSSRGGLLAFMACLVITVLVRVRSTVRYIMIASTILLLVLASRYVHGFKRFSEPFLRFEEQIANYNPKSSANLHIQSWKCSFEVLSFRTLFFGVGTGDELDVLYNCYATKGFNEMIEMKLNSHNQYLSTIVRGGLVSLVILLACFYLSARAAWKKTDVLFLCFLVLVIASSMFESILNVYRGIVFFSLINALLLKCAIEDLETESEKAI